MTKKREIVDPTLPSTPIVIGETVYRMCLDLGALAEAEHELNEKGHDVNLLFALPRVNLETTRIIFAASLRKFHPEVEFEEALALLTWPYVMPVANAIAEVWTKSIPVPEKSKANPPKPGQ